MLSHCGLSCEKAIVTIYTDAHRRKRQNFIWHCMGQRGCLSPKLHKKDGMIGSRDERVAADDGLNGGEFFELLFNELAHGAALPALGVLKIAIESQISRIKIT